MREGLATVMNHFVVMAVTVSLTSIRGVISTVLCGHLSIAAG